MVFYALFTWLMGAVVLFRWKGRWMGFFLLFLLFFLTAFRGEYIGNDTKTYLDSHYIFIHATHYANITNLEKFEMTDLGGQVELLSNLFYKIIFFNGLNERFILVFFAFIAFYFFYRAINAFKVNLAYGLAIYVILGFMSYSFNINRQMCAASVLLYAYSFLQYENKRKCLFFLFVIIASLIHSFSILFVFIYFVKFIPLLNKKWDVLLFLICLCLPVVKVNIVNQISTLLDIGHLSNYSLAYGETGLVVNKVISSYIRILLLYYFYYKWKKLYVNDNCFFANFYLLTILFSALLTNYDGSVGRIALDITVVECIFLSSYFLRKTLKYNSMDMLVLLLMIVFFSYTNFRMIEPGAPQFYLSF